MDEFFHKWLAYVNSQLDKDQFFELATVFDNMVVHNDKYYVATVPSNDSWFVYNNLCEEDYVLQDVGDDVSLVTNFNENKLKLINVIVWIDSEYPYTLNMVNPCKPYFSIDPDWTLNLAFVPDVQSELPYTYYPQEWFPYNVKKMYRGDVSYYVIRCYNILDGRIFEYDEDDSVFGIRELDSWDEE